MSSKRVRVKNAREQTRELGFPPRAGLTFGAKEYEQPARIKNEMATNLFICRKYRLKA